MSVIKLGNYLVKQTGKYSYEATNGLKKRHFTDKEYKAWLKVNLCALCLCEGSEYAPLEAHHEPPIGRSGQDHNVYWLKAIALCPKCHIKRTDEKHNKTIDLRFAAKHQYPLAFLNDKSSIIGGQ